MAARIDPPDLKAVAADVLGALTDRRQISPFSSRPSLLTVEQAHRVTPVLRAAFEASGENIAGRKIGFTNRDLWDIYGVRAPIWGYISDRTVHELGDGGAIAAEEFLESDRARNHVRPGGLTRAGHERRGAARLHRMAGAWIRDRAVDLSRLKFAAADTVAANGLHGALLVGRRQAVAPRRTEWLRELAAFGSN